MSSKRWYARDTTSAPLNLRHTYAGGLLRQGSRPGNPALKISTLGQLLRWRAEEQPGLRAYTFLPDGEAEGGELTYGDLDRRARAIAAWLQDAGAEGKFVLLLYPAGLEFIAAFFGCQLAGAVAIPAPPPKINRPSARLQSIAGDVRVHAVLTTSALLPSLGKQLSQIQELRR